MTARGRRRARGDRRGRGPRVLVLNKADALDDDRRRELGFRHPDGVLVSALDGEGLDELAARIETEFAATLRPVELLLPYSEGGRARRAARRSAGDLSARTPPRACASARACRRTWPSATSASPSTARSRREARRSCELDLGAVLPARAHDGDAGLRPGALETVVIAPGRAGAGAHGDRDRAARRPRGSGAAALGAGRRHGIALVNAPGLIDEGYRGELQVLLLNTDRDADVRVAAGMRIAQLVVVPVATPDVVELEALSETQRGDGGFGSTGH